MTATKPLPQFNMVNVAKKRITERTAIAAGTIIVEKTAFTKICDKTVPKGDVLALAEIAGIQGAKKTSNLIPLCHPLPLDQVLIAIEPCTTKDGFTVYCTVQAQAKTGVEMEALAGVQAALLTIYDLTKGTEPNLTIKDTKLLAKIGGKSGVWIRKDGIPDWLKNELPKPVNLAGIDCALVVVSDRASQGVYQDRSGELLKQKFEQLGANVTALEIIPDDMQAIQNTIQALCNTKKPDLILTSGGVGLSPRDVTPEALGQLYTRIIPGFGEILRQDGANFTQYSWLSRATAGIIDQTLVIALPGSPKAVVQGLDCLAPILDHAMQTLQGNPKAHQQQEKDGK